MKLSSINIITLFLIFYTGLMFSQGDVYLENDKSKKIGFELISNLIVVPVEVNDVTLSFVLDTGVSKPILFNLAETDSVGLKNTDTIFLYGLGGDGKIEAVKSTGNQLKLGDAVFAENDVYVVYDESINFTPRLGVLIHGIIGYDIFKDFVVEINYNNRFIRLHKPDKFKHKFTNKWERIPLQLINKKPYIPAQVRIRDSLLGVQLLIDTGSSDALWLFENSSIGLEPMDDMVFYDFLGKGLSGSIYGQRSKVPSFKLGKYSFNNANVAFPDSSSIDLNKIHKDRNGSVGGEILKRFNHFFDYNGNQLFIKSNGYFKDLFTYNNSGIVVEYNGIMFVREAIKIPRRINSEKNNAVRIDQTVSYITSIKPAYEIVEIRESSNAYKKGLRIGDIVISVDYKNAFDYKLPELNKLLHGKAGKTMRIRIERKGAEMLFKFKLDDVFKTNELSN